MKVPGTFSGPRARIWDGIVPGTHEPGFVEQPLVEVTGPPIVAGVEHHWFRMGECNIGLGHEPLGPNGELRWHLSISCPDRHPSWDEIKTARYRLLGPDTTMAMILPRAAEYVNLPQQDHVMQLHELVDGAL